MTLRTLIRWEQLRGKPYASMDPADEEDLAALLYIRYLEAHPGDCTLFATWRRALANGKLMARLVGELEREQRMLAQFAAKSAKPEAGGEPQRMAQVAAALVAAGVDARFVYDGGLQLQDLSDLCEAIGERGKQRLEWGRLWTWLGMLPHIDVKRFPHGVADIVRFPWDGDLEAKDKEIRDRDIRAFQTFMQRGKKQKEEPVKPSGQSHRG